MPQEHIKTRLSNIKSASNADNIGMQGISAPAITPPQHHSSNTVAQLVIDGTLPVKFYRKTGGSNAQTINDRLETYNEARKSESLSPEELLEQLIEIAVEVRKYLNHKTKGKAANGIMQEINDESRELSNIVFREQKEKGTKEVSGLLKGEEDIKEVKHVPFEKSPGAKAGFELEWNNVMWLDSKTDQDFMHKLLSHPQKAKVTYEKLGSKLAANFKKRTPLFISPMNTWEGQADSTIAKGANLEVVTHPLTPEQWQSQEVQTDSEALNHFSKTIDTIPPFKLFRPQEIISELIPIVGSAYLFKRGDTSGPQVQMTMATPLENTNNQYDWWLSGLNVNALPLLLSTIRALAATTFAGGNPKSVFGGTILKTPLLNVLGKPDQVPDDNAKEAWIQHVAKKAYIFDKLDNQLAEELVTYSRSRNLFQRHTDYNRENELAYPGFTWREYLEGLLGGVDKVQLWASTAFIHAGEDIGYGQIDDETLNNNWVVKEHRNDNKLKVHTYLDAGLHWAKDIGGAYDDSIRKEEKK